MLYILIVLILGKLIEDIFVFLKVFKDFGVNVLCIGIGNRYDKKEFDDIFISLDVGYVFIGDVIKFGKMIREIRRIIC